MDKIDIEIIAYNNWVNSLNKKGFPRNPDGTWMDCWQLYQYYRDNIDNTSFINHAKC